MIQIDKIIARFGIGLLILANLSYGNPDDSAYTVGGVITHFRPGHPIYLALYASAAEFKAMKSATTLRFKADMLPADSLRYQFTKVKLGEYLVAAYQDMDNDRKLDWGLFGPSEPYSIYQRSTSMFGPKFDACKFQVDKTVTNADLRF